MPGHKILINRAPVLTLWAATVAERLGFKSDEALTLGKAVAGVTAQSKGRHLGIFKPVPAELKKARAQKRGEEFFIEICGRRVPAINTDDGVRAVTKDVPINPAGVKRYLRSKFGESLAAVRAAMRSLAGSYEPEDFMQASSASTRSFAPKFRKARWAGAPRANWTSTPSAPSPPAIDLRFPSRISKRAAPMWSAGARSRFVMAGLPPPS